MGKAKSQTMNVFQIILNSCLIYLKNIIPLSRVMLFPVLGQLLGIILILYPSYVISKDFTKIFHIEITANNVLFVLLALIIAVLPGFFIFTKAFWEYMVAMVSLNSMIAGISKGGSLKRDQIKSHTQIVKGRTRSYIGLLLVLSLIWLLAILLPILLFMVQGVTPISTLMFIVSAFVVILIMLIISIYLSLCFQVFAFEEIAIINVLKRSWNLVEGNFCRTFFLGLILFVMTSFIVPTFFQTLLQSTPVVGYSAYPFKAYLANLFGDFSGLSQIPVLAQQPFFATCANPQTSVICITSLSQSLVLATVGTLITAFMLPFGSACYTLLYLDILERKGTKSKN